MARKPPAATLLVVGQIQVRKKPGSKYYYARFTGSMERKEFSLKVTDRDSAIAKATELDARLRGGDYAGLAEAQQSKGTTFGAFLDRFLESYTGWSQTTRDRNAYYLKNMRREWGDAPIRSIGTAEIQEWLGRLRVQGSPANRTGPLSPASVNLHRSYLSTVFRVAKTWGVVSRNPVKDTDPVPNEELPPDPVPIREVEQIMEVLPDYASFAVMMFVNTGLRTGELFGLTWRDVDLEEKTIRVKRSKSGEFRVVPMTPAVVSALKQRVSDDRDAPVVPGRNGKPLKSLKVSLAKAAKKLGIDHVHHHRFRHTFATVLLAHGAARHDIQDLMGHKSDKMTRRYARNTPTNLRKPIALMPEIQVPPQTPQEPRE